MLKGEREDLLSFLESREFTDQELATIASTFLSLVMNSRYSDNQKYNLVTITRKDIREKMGAEFPILRFLKVDESMLQARVVKKNERYQTSLRNKILISYPDSLEIIETLVESKVSSLNFLGFYLATGRRLSEARSENFKVIGDFEFSFSGQLKTRNPVIYTIPTLYPAETLLETLKKAEVSVNVEPNSADYQILQRLADRIFSENIHKLRAKYCVLVLKKEGCLDSDSKIDPTIRAKEILGHAFESDATFAYQLYRVTDKHSDESERIISAIKATEALKSEEVLEAPIPLDPSKSTKENLQVILEEKPFLLKLEKREAGTILRREYESRRGVKLNNLSLKNFLWEVGIIKDLNTILSPDEDRLLQRIKDSEFSDDEKSGIISLYKTYKKLKTRRFANLEMAQEVIREDFTEEELARLKGFFKNLR